MSATDIDAAKVEEFAGMMLGYLNGGALCLMTSAGYQAGLFEAMAGLPPATSAEIAEAAGLDERYVREWLAGMTVGGIVEHDPDAGTYHLPAGARGVPDESRRSRRSRHVLAVHRPVRRCRKRRARGVPARWRRSLLPLSPLSGADGGHVRRRSRQLADRRRPAARTGRRRTSRDRRRRARHRLWTRARRQSHRARVSRNEGDRLRPLGGGDRSRSRRGSRGGALERKLRGQGHPAARGAREVRPRDRVRRRPRPARAGSPSWPRSTRH